MIVTDLQPDNKPAFPSLSVTEGPFLIEVQQPLSQINSQCPPFMTGVVCSLHDEVEGKKSSQTQSTQRIHTAGTAEEEGQYKIQVHISKTEQLL